MHFFMQVKALDGLAQPMAEKLSQMLVHLLEKCREIIGIGRHNLAAKQVIATSFKIGDLPAGFLHQDA